MWAQARNEDLRGKTSAVHAGEYFAVLMTDGKIHEGAISAAPPRIRSMVYAASAENFVRPSHQWQAGARMDRCSRHPGMCSVFAYELTREI